MSQYTAYANYVIYFSDPTEYAAALALCGGNGFGHCPYTAASTFGMAVTKCEDCKTPYYFDLEVMKWKAIVMTEKRKV